MPLPELIESTPRYAAAKVRGPVGQAPLVTTGDYLSAPVDDGVDSPSGLRRLNCGRLVKEAARLLFTQPKLLKAAGRTYQCGWGTFGNTAVTLGVSAKTGRACLHGVKRCKSVWFCAECAPRLGAKRAAQLQHLLKWVDELENVHPVLLTLTFRHNKGMALQDSLDVLKTASVSMRQGRPWRERIKPVFEGSTTAIETTEGVNGSHPHLHVLLLIEAESPEAALAIVETMRPVWAAGLGRRGRDGSHPAAFQVQDGSAVSAYISKLGAEIAMASTKVGRGGGRTPFELLAASVDGDTQAGRLWVEYARCFHGTRALVWSPGLKARCGLAEVDDDDIDDGPEDDFVEVRRWEPGSGRWREARRRRLSLLTAAEEGLDLDAAEFGPTDHERWWRSRNIGEVPDG